LCSDGLWNYRPEAAELAELALPQALTDPLGAAQELVKFAIAAGGVDNITVVLAPLPLTPVRRGDDVPPPAAPSSAPAGSSVPAASPPPAPAPPPVSAAPSGSPGPAPSGSPDSQENPSDE
jgi:hypothetical protein